MKKNKYTPGKPSGDKIHPMFNQDLTRNDDLAFNTEKNSYEFDRNSDDPNYDHPLPYDTTAENGGDDNSTYDEANPYIGNEYAENDKNNDSRYLDLGMRVDAKGNVTKVSPEDEILARTPEDYRDDLDEEGYPKNDKPKKF